MILLLGALLAGPAPGGEEPDESPLPGVGGRFGGRGGHRNLRAEGGGTSTEAAVDAGLAWLAGRQDDTGAWFPAPSGDEEYATVVTSLALLAFLGAGEHEGHPVHGAVVKRGLDWLAGFQSEAGRFGPASDRLWLFDHMLATLAMAEAYAVTGRESWKKIARRGVDFLLAARSPAGGFGNGFAPEEDDPGVTVWAFRTLSDAAAAGPGVPSSVFDVLRDRMAAWEEAGTRPAGPLFPLSPGALSAGFVFCRERRKHEWDYRVRDDPAVAVASALLDGKPTVGDWYMGTLGVFLAGGDPWRDWNEKMKSTLLPLQATEGPDAGSWDPATFGEKSLGRAGVTAALTTCFEIYYLYGR